MTNHSSCVNFSRKRLTHAAEASSTSFAFAWRAEYMYPSSPIGTPWHLKPLTAVGRNP